MAHRQIVKFSLGSFYILTSILLLGLFTTNKPAIGKFIQNISPSTIASLAQPVTCHVGCPPCEYCKSK